MDCGFEYCIYNRDNMCGLEEIEINELGMCDDCVIVSIPEEFLGLMKDSQLKEMDERYRIDET